MITIGDVVPARGVPVEQLWEDLRRNGLTVRNNDRSYALTNYSVRTDALVVAGHGDTDDDRGSHDSGDGQVHGGEAQTGWDIDVNIG